MQVQIGVAGLGVVAQGFLSLVQQHSETHGGLLNERSIVLKRIASRRLRDDVDLGTIEFDTNLDSLINDPEIDLVVELIGGIDTAYDLIKAALNSGKGVITANKALIAVHGNELLTLSAERGVPLAFEAAVAGGIPIIAALKSAFSGNRIRSLTGIINGTCNYILSQMTNEGAEFADALLEAQKLGYAEADPTFDVGGMDAAQKLAILGALAFHVPINVNDVYCEGIEEINADDIRHAADLGYAIKHLGVASRGDDKLEFRVHPAFVADGNLLAKVADVENAVQVEGESTGTLRFMGPGAGGLATASSVMADLTAIVAGQYRAVQLGGAELAIQPIATVESAFYLNIATVDRPGAIAHIGETLARRGISIDSMIQKKEEEVAANGESVIPVIILTNKVIERELDSALQELDELPEVNSPIKRIRVVGS